MELKRLRRRQDFQTQKCFTRTFMELKLSMQLCPFSVITVLLVPLWNWNGKDTLLDNRSMPFYSYLYGIETEDKTGRFPYGREFYSYLYGIETSSSLNVSGSRCSFTRTFMELKPCLTGACISWYSRFTRTFMELKHYSLVYTELIYIVLLVPLWNWNYILFTLFDFTSAFYSYLYGIETSLKAAPELELQSFTRTFMELKH